MHSPMILTNAYNGNNLKLDDYFSSSRLICSARISASDAGVERSTEMVSAMV